jgi:6-phosphogluconolactonase (cycloisomerase 2 family)
MLRGHRLAVVNAGSNEVSLFKVVEAGPKPVHHLVLTSLVATCIRPVSVDMRHHLLYVVCAGDGSDGSAEIRGYLIGPAGTLGEISAQPLSDVGAAPAQVALDPYLVTVIVMEKATNKIGVFSLDAGGVAGPGVFLDSSAPTPFGAAQVGAWVLAYTTPNPSALSTISSIDGSPLDGPVEATGQAAACWAVYVNGFVYTGNAGGTVSKFRVNRNTGAISLLQAEAASPGAGVTELAGRDGTLAALRSGAGRVHVYRINPANGNLNGMTQVPVPVGSNGLVVHLDN